MDNQQQEVTEAPQTPEEVPAPAPITVSYVFAGANAGGQALYNCLVCSAMVQEASQPNHTAWHQNGSA